MPLQMKHLKYDYVDRGLGKLSNATSTAYYRVIDWPSAQVGVAAHRLVIVRSLTMWRHGSPSGHYRMHAQL